MTGIGLTVWESREWVKVYKQIVLQFEPDEVVEGCESLWLDGGDLAFCEVESLQLLKFKERVPRHLSYRIAPQIEHHEVTAIPESLLGHVVQEVPTEVDLHQVGDPLKAAAHHHADAAVVEEDLLQVVQVSLAKHALPDFGKVVEGEIKHLSRCVQTGNSAKISI